jgi:hypothetical protein
MNAQRYRHSSAVLPNGDILVCGGDNGGYGGNNATFLSSCEIFNYTSNTWTAVASMSVPRQGNFLVNLPSGIVAAIGNTYNPNPATNPLQTSIEFFNPISKTWSQSLAEAIAASNVNGNNALCSNGQIMIDGNCEAPCAAGTENVLGTEGTGAVSFSAETLKTNYNFWRITASLDGMGGDWIKANTTTAMGGAASQGDDPFIEIRWDGMCRTGQGWYNNGPYQVVWSDWAACGSQFSAVDLSSSRNYFSYKVYSCY